MPVDDLVLDPMRWMGPTALTLDSNLFIIILFFHLIIMFIICFILCGNDRLVMLMYSVFGERMGGPLLKMRRSRPDDLPRFRKCCTATYLHQSSVVLCKGEEPFFARGRELGRSL